MKKFIVVLLALVMIFSMAACGKKSGNTGPFPKEVTVYIPQKEGNMLDKSGRVMVKYWEKMCPDTKFTIKNTTGNGNDHAKIVAEAQKANDGSVIMMHGAGAIAQFYSGEWDYNLADHKYFKAIAGNIGQMQPSGAVTLISADETRFDSIETLVEYIKKHPKEIRISYTQGTPHEVRIKLILNYFGIKASDVKEVPGSATDIRTWIQGHTNTDVAIITETQAAQDIKGGKVKGILNSVASRDLYTDDLAPLKPVPIVPEIKGVKAEDAMGLVCAWPMTIYGPASMPDKLCQEIADLCATILKDEDFMKQVKALGSTNTYQIFTLKEIDEAQQDANVQIKKVIEQFNK